MTPLLFAILIGATPITVTAAAYNADGTTLALGTKAKAVLLSHKDGSVLKQFDNLSGRVTALAFVKDALVIAHGDAGKEGLLRVDDIDTKAHKDSILCVAVSPGGRTVATASYDRTIKLWTHGDLSRPLHTLTDHSDAVYAVAFNHDGTLLASGSADRAVKVWDVATGKRLYTLSDPTDWVYAVAWHPKTDMLAAAGVDKSVRLWQCNREGGKLLHSVFAHEKAVAKLAFNPAGDTLVSVGEDRVTKLWTSGDLKEKHVLKARPDTVQALAVHPKGGSFVLANHNGEAEEFSLPDANYVRHVWPVKPPAANVKNVTPNAVTRGTTATLKIDGTNLADLEGVKCSNTGVTTTLNDNSVEITATASAQVGPAALNFIRIDGSTMSVPIFVDRFAVVAEKADTDSAKTSQLVALPCTVAGRLDRYGDADFYQFEGVAGQEVGFEVSTAALATKFEPVLTLHDATGKVIVESTKGHLGAVLPAAGRYAISLRDRDYRGGPELAYRLHAGPIPIVTGVWRLGVTREMTKVMLHGVNLSKSAKFTVNQGDVMFTEAAKPGSIAAVRIPAGYLGGASVILDEFPSSNDSTAMTVPGHRESEISGRVSERIVSFPAKKGHPLILEVHSQRLGLDTDFSLDILDSQGQLVPRAVLRCVAMTNVAFRDHDSKQGNIRLVTWNELAMDDYIYCGTELMRMKDLPGHPDADANFVTVAGQRVAYLGTTAQHHFTNQPMYKVSVHPPGTTFPPNGMPVFTLHYRNDDGGPGFGRDPRLRFDPPADGTYSVRVRSSSSETGGRFRLTVRPPRPDFSIAVTPKEITLPAGVATPVTITATRLDEFDGPVHLKFSNVPGGVHIPETTIEAGQTTAVVAVHAGPEVINLGSMPIIVTATATIDGTSVRRVATFGPLKLGTAPDLVVSAPEQVVFKPGTETTIRVQIERRNGFKGRVPVDVRGLPHGVRVMHIGLNGVLITEKETERDVVLYAEPWVKDLAIPFAVVGKMEAKNGKESAAKSVLLTVSK